MSQTGRLVTGWKTVIALVGYAMTGTVFADNNAWGKAAIAYGLFGLSLYLIGTASYRLSISSKGRVEADSLLGLRPIELDEGFTVKRGLGVFVMRAHGKRYRINPALGPASAIEQWRTAAAAAPAPQRGSTVSGNG